MMFATALLAITIAYATPKGVFIDAKQVTHDSMAIVPQDAWSPDGKRLLFLAERTEDNSPPMHFPLYVVNAGGTDERRLVDSALPDPQWSPDGTSILFRSGDALFIAEAATGSVRPLTSGGSASWSPDGTRIVFTGADGIYIIDADGTHRTRLSNLKMHERNPVWSPDGKSIAFIGNGWFVMDADGANKKRVSKLQATRVQWSPDGAHLLVSGGGGAYVCDRDGTNGHGLPSSYGPIIDPVFAPDGRIIFRTPAKLYSVRIDGRDLRTINDRFAENRGFAVASR